MTFSNSGFEPSGEMSSKVSIEASPHTALKVIFDKANSAPTVEQDIDHKMSPPDTGRSRKKPQGISDHGCEDRPALRGILTPANQLTFPLTAAR